MFRAWMRIAASLGVAAACAGWPKVAMGDNPAETFEMPTTELVGETPLPGLGIRLEDVPANVQIYTADDLRKQHHNDLSEYLEQNGNAVSIDSGQGNPFQPDVNFRGFTASPLLGTPEGLSVFQDGVRVNEPFGDVVNWDFMPQSAISSIQLIPGSNPAFGLNTLGGALAIYTKSGSQFPGASVQGYGGSFGRRSGEFEVGGRKGNGDYFLTGNHLDDEGWADHNPSRVDQLFGKVGWQDDKSDLDLSFTAADNTLEGTQTIPRSFFDDVRQAYTFPDRNENQLVFPTLKGSRFLGSQLLLGGNLYYRRYRNENVSSNVNDDFGQTDPETGMRNTVEATNDRSRIDQDGYGFGLQLTFLRDVWSKKNQFVIGTTGDFADARFTEDSQEAEFTPNRGTVGTSRFSREVEAKTANRYYGGFFTDTLSLDQRFALTISGRYNRAEAKIRDETGEAPLLNGEHSFSRFNPAAGLNFNPTERLTAYAAYSEGMRAPTPIELTCANPDAPCKLPNNFLADPALKKVISRTIEVGARGKLGDSSKWSAALYRTDLADDIQFVSSSGAAVNAGFFQNVGETRRQGIELSGVTSASTRFGRFGLTTRYAYVDATFRSGFIENSPSNSSANGQGDIQVKSGDRIPGIPPHNFKARLEYAPIDSFSAGVNVVFNSGVFARGDENNKDVNGAVPGYAIVNLDARYRIIEGLEIFGRADNLFNKRYSNFGVLAENFFTGPDRTFGPAAGTEPIPEQFRGPGVPVGAWIGLRYDFL